MVSSESTSNSRPDPAIAEVDQLLEVGRIAKPHGLRGDLVVALTTDRTERLNPGTVLDTERGPVTVLTSQPHGDRWIVRFDGIVDRTAAEAWRGIALRAEPLADEGTLWVHDLIGCRVQEIDGTARGTVESVQDNPAAELLVLDTGALVPVIFVLAGPENGELTVDVPDGLFELFEQGAQDKPDLTSEAHDGFDSTEPAPNRRV